ncbi:hypothetical protein [Candidatus Burkholderia verschuerenii]|uniref:hypothetical protein n=1 Tax=Candidatus Burkholderia verschuerenii TaxID=242163 RepID=UPI000AD61999|nr:hypothetical protein [Candidatus Burkholderia verschuerenii]
MTPFDAAHSIDKPANSLKRLMNGVQAAMQWIDDLADEVRQVREQAADRLR